MLALDRKFLVIQLTVPMLLPLLFVQIPLHLFLKLPQKMHVYLGKRYLWPVPDEMWEMQCSGKGKIPKGETYWYG